MKRGRVVRLQAGKVVKLQSCREVGLQLIGAFVTIALFLVAPRVVQAHGGGMPRLTGVEAGPYRLYAWSQPDPWRVEEELHLSIGVTKSDTQVESTQVETMTGPALEQLVDDVNVRVRFTSLTEQSREVITRTASATEALGGTYYEADVELPTTGDWQVEVIVTSAEGDVSATFVANVMPKRQISWLLVGGGAVVMVLLLVIAAVVGRMQGS